MKRTMLALLPLAWSSPRVPNADTPAPPPRWLLVYSGGRAAQRPEYSVTQFLRTITHVDTLGRPQYRVFTGVILLELSAPSGRMLAAWLDGVPANGQDWSAYLDSLFRAGGVLNRLDSAVALARETLGAPPAPFGIAIMIPYPKPSSGRLEFAGRVYRLRNMSGRAAAVQAYARDVERRFGIAQFANLRLDGLYWFREDAPPGDAELIRRTAVAVHAAGLRLLWIPYYLAENWDHWRELGFDAAWLQPNYFFDPAIPVSRIDSAAAYAERSGMGLEVEFDGRVSSNPVFADRLDPYLGALGRYPGLRARGVAVYEGGGGLVHLAWSRVARDRALYDTLDEALR